MSVLESPIPLADIEAVLAWVDTFKLSRNTKKINRDFSDAVLLAEILSVHYPKLVEMHNYPPRNSQSLKLNNWMTLNRKVLKKLRLNLCSNTMEQLANCTAGVIERVLVMVREKIRRDEDLNKSLKEGEQNMSSGGSYYEACGEDEHVLVVPVKTRVNGVLETMQHKVVSHECYLALKQELKDAKESVELLKQKVEHLDNLIKLKEERIEALQKQLDRKQIKRKEVEAVQNSLSVPFESEPPSPKVIEIVNGAIKPLCLKSIESNTKIGREESKIPIPKLDVVKSLPKFNITELSCKDSTEDKSADISSIRSEREESKIPIPKGDVVKSSSKPSITDVLSKDFTEDISNANVDRIRSDVFKEVEIIDQRVLESFQDSLEYICDPNIITTIDDTVQKEIKDISQMDYGHELSYLN